MIMRFEADRLPKLASKTCNAVQKVSQVTVMTLICSAPVSWWQIKVMQSMALLE